MGKTLVGVDNLECCICRENNTFYADGSVILTPGAKDELSRRGIAVVYGPRPETEAHAPQVQSCPPGCTCPACTGQQDAAAGGPERLVLAVAAILKEQYGVSDPEQLKILSAHVVKTIHDNI